MSHSVSLHPDVNPIADSPCVPVAYSAACGADLALGADFTETGNQTLSLRVGSTPVPGVLAIGTQRTAIPIGPCVLRNEALVVIALSTVALRFEAPSVTGFRFNAQGFALDNGNLVATAGVELTCR